MNGIEPFDDSDGSSKGMRLRKTEAVIVLLGVDDLNKAYEVGLLIDKLLKREQAEGYRRKE